MLYTETVTRSTLELLKKLEAERMMVGFNLAGGTSLSLYLGHRLSLDLDLFTPESFDAVQLEQFLKEEYGFRTDFMGKNTLKGTIDGVKINQTLYRAFLVRRFNQNVKKLYDQASLAEDWEKLKKIL